jgi:hypothetical protein
MERTKNTASPLMVALTWLVVSIPLGWGVYQSVMNSRPLFQGSSGSQ